MNRALLTVAVVSGSSSLLLVDSAIKGGVILLLAALVALTLRRDSAATRHLVWLVAIVAMLVVPVFSAMLPQSRVLPAWAVIAHESPAVDLPVPAVEMPEQAQIQVPSPMNPDENDRPFATGNQPVADVTASQILLVESDATATAQLSTDDTSLSNVPHWHWANALPLVWAIGCSGKQPAKDNNAATDESKPKPGTTLEAGIEQKLKWGEPVNGLRAAIMIRRVGDKPYDLFVVAQNVSETEIQINDSTTGNEHTLYIKLSGELVAAMSGPDTNFGNRLLQPREVAIMPVMSPEPKADPRLTRLTAGEMMAANALADAQRTMYVEIVFENVPAGTWKGKLVTAETNGAEAAVFRDEDHSKASSGEKLNAGIEQKLKWGEPANGLRAALAIRDSSDGPNTRTPDLYLAVQNVSDAPIHLHDAIDVRGQRLLTIFRDELAQSQTRIDEPTMANVILQPREATFLRMVPHKPGPANGQLLAKGMLLEPRMLLVGQMNVDKAPAGAWTGTLITAKTGGAAAIGYPVPKHKTAQALFKQWQANARLNGKIPGGRLRSLAKATSNFVGYNPTDERAPKLRELLKRMDVARDWTQQEAVDLLNDVTDVYDNLPSWATDLQRFSIADDVRIGQPIPDDLKNAPWGDAQPNGLRVAWLLDPQSAEHRLNTPLKSRLLYHNTGRDTVVFRVVTWNQSGAHKARNADGENIDIRATSWTTIGQIVACRLAPGQFTEVIGAGIGIGPNVNQEDWRNTRVGAWIHAKAGDEVTFTPDEITTSGADGRQNDVADAVWWLSFITDRLERDAPLPDDAHERKRLLERAMVDLFGTLPTPEETATFLADKSPQALEALAKRLVKREGTAAVFGKLRSGTTTFRVLPIDPDAKNNPRLAIGPGRYELGNNARLVIVGRGHVMDAKLEFSSDDAPIKSHKIKLPNKLRTWAIAWKRDITTLWIAEEGKLRSVDFTIPAEVKETQIDPADTSKVPDRFLKALRPTFERKPQPPPAAAKG